MTADRHDGSFVSLLCIRCNVMNLSPNPQLNQHGLRRRADHATIAKALPDRVESLSVRKRRAAATLAVVLLQVEMESPRPSRAAVRAKHEQPVSVSTLSDGPPITQIDGRGGWADECGYASESRRAFIALAPARTTGLETMTSDGPADEGRPVVLRESSVVLGSLASGALSPSGGEARRSDRRCATIRSMVDQALPVSVSRGL